MIGNFPYNISSQIFFKILEHRDRVPEVVCMIQKEVASAHRREAWHQDIRHPRRSFFRHGMTLNIFFTVGSGAFNPLRLRSVRRDPSHPQFHFWPLGCDSFRWWSRPPSRPAPRPFAIPQAADPAGSLSIRLFDLRPEAWRISWRNIETSALIFARFFWKNKKNLLSLWSK